VNETEEAGGVELPAHQQVPRKEALDDPVPLAATHSDRGPGRSASLLEAIGVIAGLDDLAAVSESIRRSRSAVSTRS
jgi:hypothetical protein